MATVQEIWGNCLSIIRDNVTEDCYKTFFKDLLPIKLENNTLLLQANSHFIVEHIEGSYLDLMRKVIRKELGTARLEWKILMAGTTTKPIPQREQVMVHNRPVPLVASPPKFNPFIVPGLKTLEVDSQLDPKYTFENYIEGDCNRLARSAGMAIAQRPGETAFSPVFIHGNTGAGKTHLAHAIGLETKRLHPQKVVLYLSARRFQEQFVSATQKNEINDFLNFYQMIDVLILDDVHDFARKTGTQNTFFHIFDHLQNAKKQLILTADKPPIELEGFEKRVLSRFKWGLTAELTSPDYETRLKIFKHKVYRDGIEIGDDVVEYLASKITDGVREFEGVLTTLLAQAAFNKKTLSVEVARNTVEKNVRTTPKEYPVEQIQKTVFDYFQIPLVKSQSSTRKREIVQARQVAMYFCKMLTENSLAAIGAKIGGKNHATVLHACKTVNNMMETNRTFKDTIVSIEKKLKAI
ncbi:chromosomal replication initiator protein DnaA [Bacteroidia bacterium]|nr:chromosomal replication initiator protein DnaA [Bacteroidia bacterium]